MKKTLISAAIILLLLQSCMPLWDDASPEQRKLRGKWVLSSLGDGQYNRPLPPNTGQMTFDFTSDDEVYWSDQRLNYHYISADPDTLIFYRHDTIIGTYPFRVDGKNKNRTLVFFLIWQWDPQGSLAYIYKHE